MSRRNRRASTSRHASAHQTQGGDMDEEQDLASMAKQLKRIGLGIRDVRRDGNCFFRAVSDQLYGTESHHAYLRQCACGFMQRNEELLAPFLDDENQSFQQYVEHMRGDGIWAGNIEIHAISQVFGVNIRIHQSSKPSYDLRNWENPDARPIHLFYHFGEHYASVRPLHQLHVDTPAEHDPLPTDGNSSDDATDDATQQRRPKRVLEDVNTIWEQLDGAAGDVQQLILHAEAAAQYFRRPLAEESGLDSPSIEMVRELEGEVRLASDILVEVQNRITSWRGAHAARSEHREQNGSVTDDDDDNQSSTSDASSDYESCSDGGWDSDSASHAYDRVVRRERRYLFEALDEAEAAIIGVMKKATDLRAVRNGRGKNRHLSKKKQQEERRKHRKTRRRQEQEGKAKHATALPERKAKQATGRNGGAGYSIGFWGVHHEVYI